MTKRIFNQDIIGKLVSADTLGFWAVLELIGIPHKISVEDIAQPSQQKKAQ